MERNYLEKSVLKRGESDTLPPGPRKPINTFDDLINQKEERVINTFDDIRSNKNEKEIVTFGDLQKEKSLSKNKANEISEAQQKWDKIKGEIEISADSLGYEIDKGIKDPVVALNAFEINTGQSCEGHIDSGMSAPWIRIEAPNEPEERFIGQKESFEKVAKKYNMPVEEAKRMFNIDAYWEAMHECQTNGETEEFKKWKEESGKLLYIAKDILDDFYKNRQVSDSIKIKTDTESMEDIVEGSFEIFNGGEDYRNINDIELSKEEKESLGKRINEYRKEMQEFAEFLKEKFFNDGENYIKDKRDNTQKKVDQEKIKSIMDKLNK